MEVHAVSAALQEQVTASFACTMLITVAQCWFLVNPVRAWCMVMCPVVSRSVSQVQVLLRVWEDSFPQVAAKPALLSLLCHLFWMSCKDLVDWAELCTCCHAVVTRRCHKALSLYPTAACWSGIIHPLLLNCNCATGC